MKIQARLYVSVIKICFHRRTCYAIVENVKIHARLYVSVIKSARGKLAFFELVSRDIVTNSIILKLQNLYAERKIVWMHFNFCYPF